MFRRADAADSSGRELARLAVPFFDRGGTMRCRTNGIGRALAAAVFLAAAGLFSIAPAHAQG
jgi:hypothetical protein